ncbi:PAS domain S-box protein [bacterium endosymbiont of Escarpia laminata]|nr:MAG: PAS domain S-box protein [bacterium endosymbiont of Escarpia laminata]
MQIPIINHTFGIRHYSFLMYGLWVFLILCSVLWNLYSLPLTNTAAWILIGIHLVILLTGILVNYLFFHKVLFVFRVSKLAEQALKEERQFLNTILESISDGIVVCDKDGHLTLFNPAARTFLGSSELHIPVNECAAQYGLHSADGTHLLARDESPLYRTLQEGKVREQEVFVSPPNGGTERTLLANGETLANKEGERIGAVVTLHDITSQKALEQELRLSAMVFEAHDAMIITDDQGRIQRVNRRFVEMTGYSPEDVFGKTPSILKSGRHDDRFYRNLWKQLTDSGSWQGEIWNQRRNGEVYPQWTSISLIRDDKGTIIHFLSSMVDVSKQRRAEAEVEFLAYHDSLTGLPNRVLLFDRLNQALARSSRSGSIGASVFIDLDRFKNINDSLGHLVGDGMLKEFARRLKKLVRKDDTLARLGGDEFMMVLNELGPDQESATNKVLSIAEKFKASLAEPYHIREYELHTTSSIGVTLFSGAGETAEDIIRRADTAMYKAKEEGRNAIRFYLPEMQAQVRDRLAMENDMRIAMERDQFKLFFQPQIDIQTGELIGAEALLRWRHPERGYILPDHFIPIAEDTGLIVSLGEFVLREVCCRNRIWHDAGLPKIPIAVNVSPVQFRRTDFLNQVNSILNDTQLSPHYLELEMTETAFMQNIVEVKDTLAKLKAQGVNIAIDDFGTGFSSLSYLNQMAIDKLKIDQSFIQDVSTDKNNATITKTIISMAQYLNLKTIGEGVETLDQFKFLQNSGCDEVQGFLFHEPVPMEIFSDMLKNWHNFKVMN